MMCLLALFVTATLQAQDIRRLDNTTIPAAEATVCTMLFSRMLESFTALRIAIEITAAGIDDANVRPTLSPR